MILKSGNGKIYFEKYFSNYMNKSIENNSFNTNNFNTRKMCGILNPYTNYSKNNSNTNSALLFSTFRKTFSSEEKNVKILKASNYMNRILDKSSTAKKVEPSEVNFNKLNENVENESEEKKIKMVLKPSQRSSKISNLDIKKVNKEADIIQDNQKESVDLEKTQLKEEQNPDQDNNQQIKLPQKIKISFDIFDPMNVETFSLIIKNKPEVALIILEKNLDLLFSNSRSKSKLDSGSKTKPENEDADNSNIKTSTFVTNFSQWLDYFYIFMSHIVFYPNKLDLFPKFQEILKKITSKIQELERELAYDESDILNNQLINFVSVKIREIQYPDTIFIFYFFYTFLSNLFQIKELITLLKTVHHSIKSYQDIFGILRINKAETPTDLIKILLEHFPHAIKDFNPIKNEINQLCELIIIYQYYYFKLKGTKKDSFSMMLSNFDEMIGKSLENNMKSDLFYFLEVGLIKIKQPSSNYILLPNIYSLFCKKFNLENLTYQHGYIFVHSKFIRDFFKESHTSKTLSSLFMSNIFYLGECLRDKNLLKKIDDELIVHLIYVLTQVRYQIDNELLEEIKERLDFFLTEFNYIKINALVASLSMIEDNNIDFHPFFRKVLMDHRMSRISSKHFLNIGFYISMTKLDDIHAWTNWFQNFNKKYFRFNDMDCKMLKELKKNLEVMVGSQYKQFAKIYNIEVEGNMVRNMGFERWFYSKDLGAYSNTDVLILKILRKLNLKFSTQVMINDMFLCDFLLGDKIILELNGPHHYYCTNLLKLEYKAKFKKEFMEKLGYYVVGINIITINKFSKNGEGAEILDIIKTSVPEEEYLKIFRN